MTKEDFIQRLMACQYGTPEQRSDAILGLLYFGKAVVSGLRHAVTVTGDNTDLHQQAKDALDVIAAMAGDKE